MTESGTDTATPAPSDGAGWAVWAGLAVWTVVSVVLAVIEVFLLPLSTSGGRHLPVAVVLAVLGNLLLPRVFVRGLGLRFGWALPAVVWFGVILASASQTSDGDLLISGSDYAAGSSGVFLVVGAVSVALGSAVAATPIRDVLRRGRVRSPAPGDVARSPAAPSPGRRRTERPERE